MDNWTLELLKLKAAADPGFSFYSETNPNCAKQLECGEVVEFRSGYAHTASAAAALELLSMSDVQPGQWAKDTEKYVEQVLAQEAAAAKFPDELKEARPVEKKRKKRG